MAKLTQYKKVVKPVELLPENRKKVQGKFLIKIGKEFYRRLQPVPWKYCKPDYNQFTK